MIRLTPNSESLREFNTCHAPAGSPKGGQFCSKDAAEAIRTASPAFKAWFGKSQVVDKNGQPLRVYHGTLSQFDEFDPSRGNIEGDMGAGLYFTNNPDDANSNYSKIDGADVEAKISDRVARLENDYDFDEELQARVDTWLRARSDSPTVPDALRVIAVQDLGIAHGGASIPVYLRIENPAIVSSIGEPGTFLDYDIPYDEATEDYGDPSGKLAEFLSELRSVAAYFDDVGDEGFDHLYGDAMNSGGIPLNVLIQRLRDSEHFANATDPNTGKLAANEIIRRTLQRIGFDGIIDKSVRAKFSRMPGVHSDTVHYIVFSPEQVKSAIGNKGTYSRKSRKFTEHRR